MNREWFDCHLCGAKGGSLWWFARHMAEAHLKEGPWTMEVNGVVMVLRRSGMVPYEKP